ncbi:VOC family protein [Pseudomonas oryzihabitans]|uniref:VOC family protein n=1 Tax=Pseudomonas oryzihabitans TaxID=47885 RepID=UPI001D9C7859|nr:VOC family protein [Pseudomonas oryzihabitans]HJE70674.1 VOC family protein [Pseudomonas oryzihabitans]
MRLSHLDHLVIVAPTLAAGARYVEERLGVALQPGGQHARMGTHNLLLGLGDGYLEVIAPDPDAPPPTRPRWFGLDELALDAAPRLAHWVAGTQGLAQADAHLTRTFGRIESMSRGALAWQISIHADGQLPLGGVLPSLIDWGDARHPAAGLIDQGCRLQRLELRHPDAAGLGQQLEAIGFAGPVAVLPGERPGLLAYLETPTGLKTL